MNTPANDRNDSTIVFTITGQVVALCHRHVHDELGFPAGVQAVGGFAA